MYGLASPDTAHFVVWRQASMDLFDDGGLPRLALLFLPRLELRGGEAERKSSAREAWRDCGRQLHQHQGVRMHDDVSSVLIIAFIISTIGRGTLAPTWLMWPRVAVITVKVQPQLSCCQIYILITFDIQTHLTVVVDILFGIKQHNYGKVKTKRINHITEIAKMCISMFK